MEVKVDELKRELKEKEGELASVYVYEEVSGMADAVEEALTPGSEASLRQISQNLGPHSRMFLAKRIETNNPQVKKDPRKSWVNIKLAPFCFKEVF